MNMFPSNLQQRLPCLCSSSLSLQQACKQLSQAMHCSRTDPNLGRLLTTSIPLKPLHRARLLEARHQLESTYDSVTHKPSSAMHTYFIKSQKMAMYELDGHKRGSVGRDVDRGVRQGDSHGIVRKLRLPHSIPQCALQQLKILLMAKLLSASSFGPSKLSSRLHDPVLRNAPLSCIKFGGSISSGSDRFLSYRWSQSPPDFSTGSQRRVTTSFEISQLAEQSVGIIHPSRR